jgi:glutathione peroxidase
VSFQIMEKIDVNGKNVHPVFAFLRKRASGAMGDSVKWNFTKFLVAKDGSTVKRFAPRAEPASLESDIEKVL